MPDLVQSMFSYNEVPWHGKGQIVDHALTAEEAIVEAGMDWRVDLHPACLAGAEIPDAYAVVRQDIYKSAPTVDKAVENGAVLGLVGSKYHPVQNSELFSFFDPVVDRDAGAFYHTGGVLKGGRVVWLLAKVPGDFYVVPDDKIENYLLLASSHDGSLPILAKHTPVRVVCWNTLSASLNIKATEVRIKHTRTAEYELQVAHKILGLATKRASMIQEAAEALLGYTVTPRILTRFLKRLLPSQSEKDGEEASKKAIAQREKVEILFAGADTNTMPGMKGTGWALYNAVAEYADHHKPAKSGTDTVHRMWFGSGEDLKLKAWKMLLNANKNDWEEA